jgi:hypothetical protein
MQIKKTGKKPNGTKNLEPMAIRRIYCEACGKWAGLEPEDRFFHWQCRTCTIIASKPPKHSITITDYEKGKPVKSECINLPTLFCDHCGQPIPDGSIAIAYTAWRGKEPGPWETDYAAKPK